MPEKVLKAVREAVRRLPDVEAEETSESELIEELLLRDVDERIADE